MKRSWGTAAEVPLAVVTVTSTASGPGAPGTATVTAPGESDRIGALRPSPKCTALASCNDDPKMVRVPPPVTGPLPALSAITAGHPPAGWKALVRTAPSGVPQPVAM